MQAGSIASTDVKDLQKGLYVEGADFTDVKATDWSAGYIGYCANGGIVKGNGDGTFGPAAQVTGYQVLAMALRAVGYDKNGEFTGADWAKNVATTAQALGILENVPGTVQLSQPATRELVAELVFQTLQTKMVEYTPAFGYQPAKVWAGELGTLGAQQFALKAAASEDDFGRPTTVYTY
ncbi:MAG: S-layer homology domain-containing protein, partial [Peptococcaceae bacterium]|nr:S-layer homology domain-containing protein [Peptococcaceae bacterium]